MAFCILKSFPKFWTLFFKEYCQIPFFPNFRYKKFSERKCFINTLHGYGAILFFL
jgi:hypothetical protein